MTNREFLEQKSDEELAEFYYDLINSCIKLGFYRADYTNDKERILEYLQEEYKRKE